MSWKNEIKIEDLPETFVSLAAEIGLENTLKVIRVFEGGEVYFPKFEGAFKNVRDAAIRREWRKHNITHLAHKFGLTGNQIRNIVNDHEDQEELFPTKQN